MLTALPPSGRPITELEHTQLRLRLIEGHAQEDLHLHVVRTVGAVRAAAWGSPSRTANPLRDLASAVAVLYDEEPLVAHPQAPQPVVEDFVERLRVSGLWQVLAEAQFLTEALNETAVAVELDEDTGGLLWRVITPDLLDGQAEVGRPGHPALLREWRPRVNARGRSGDVDWFVDVWDLRDRDRPVFRIEDARGNDVTGDYVEGGAREGDAYPWRYAPSPRFSRGRPFIPISLRHSRSSPRRLFAPFFRVETVDGTLDAGALGGQKKHVAFQASFPLTLLVGGRLVSGVTEQTDSKGQPIARAPTLDPAAIHEVEPTEPGQQASVQVVRNETDLLMLQEYGEREQAGLATPWGLTPADLQRTAADARSGVALAISGEGRRRMQAARAPVYRPEDERLLGIAAALLRSRGIAPQLPDRGWVVTHRLSPLSPQERAQRQAEAESLYDRGLITRAEFRSMVMGEPLAVAARALDQARTERAPAPTPPASAGRS
jgi:hypothetical protein